MQVSFLSFFIQLFLLALWFGHWLRCLFLKTKVSFFMVVPVNGLNLQSILDIYTNHLTS